MTLAPMLAPLSVALLLSAPSPRTIASDASLSLFFEPVPERCHWMRVDPVAGRRELVAEIPGACAGLTVSWSPDTRHALVQLPGRWENGRWDGRRAFLADLRVLPAATRELEIPQEGILDLLAFGEDGAPVALVLDQPRTLAPEALFFEGRRFELAAAAPGVPVLAHAFRHGRRGWERIETVATSVEACDAPGTLYLEAAHRLAPTSARLLDPAFGHVSMTMLDGDLLRLVEPWSRLDAEATYGWLQLETPRGTVVGVEGSADYPFLTTPLLFVDEDGPRELAGIPENAVLAVAARGRWLLVTEAVSGARARLYDLERGELVHEGGDAVVVTFWPDPSAPAN